MSNVQSVEHSLAEAVLGDPPVTHDPDHSTPADLPSSAAAGPIRSGPLDGTPLATSAVVIAIDGPAGTGKSSVARELAARLALDFLDTGAMYRAAAAIVIDHGLDPTDEAAVVAKLADADLHFDWTTDPPAMLAWMKPVDERIRDADVTRLVSDIAAMPSVREHLVRKQRIIAHQHPRLVSEGRDQGTVVFPGAFCKFYLDADASVRAARRAEQLRAAGNEASEAELEKLILERDRIDSTRAVGPLVRAHDAIVVDTSELSFDQVVEHLLSDVLGRARNA